MSVLTAVILLFQKEFDGVDMPPAYHCVFLKIGGHEHVTQRLNKGLFI